MLGNPKYAVLFLIFMAFNARAQKVNQPLDFKNLPVLISANFNAIAFPGDHIGDHFQNFGMRLGTEVFWNKRGNLVQSANLGYYRNRLNGNGIYLNTELIYRPKIYNRLRMEFKLGPGISEIFLPMQAWEADGNGGWKKSSATTPVTFQIHTAVGFSYEQVSMLHATLSPFISYEFIGLTGYNPSIPVLPTTFLHVGSRIRF